MIAAARKSTRALASGAVRLQLSNAFVAVSSAMSASRSPAAATRPTTCDGFAGLTETISPSVSILLPPMTSGWPSPRRSLTSCMAERIAFTFASSDQSRYGSFLYGMSPIFCLLSLYLARDATEHVFRDVAGDLGVLLEAPARVLVPVLPKGHVDPELVPGPYEYASQLLVHAEEHLELVAVLGHLELVDEPQGVPDQKLVVGRDPHVGAAPQELLEKQPVVLADGVEVLVG